MFGDFESSDFDVLWLNVSPRLKWLDRALVERLAGAHRLGYWEYRQTADEASSLDTALTLLYECLQSRSRPIHLVAHGLGGALALNYARRYPALVQSVVVLGVATQPACTWHVHYYAQRSLIPCTQARVLVHIARTLFGSFLPISHDKVIQALAHDLDHTPSPHSIFKIGNLPQGPIAVPLMVCGSRDDAIVTPPMLADWRNYFKPCDTLWYAPTGRHFFHYFHPEATAQQIEKFWHQVQTPNHPLINIGNSYTNSGTGII